MDFNLYRFISVPLPCIVSEWTAWSEPDATGTRFRFRMMLRPALNGGKECPDLIELTKGEISYSIKHSRTYRNGFKLISKHRLYSL